MLKANQPELPITPQNLLCLQLAGLCHDLGHGPFSHMFDAHFIKPLLKSGELKYDKGTPVDEWEHEHASADMIDYIIEAHDLKEQFEEAGLRVPQDVEVIKSLITGHRPEDSEHGHYMYQIVANKDNNIDVDKCAAAGLLHRADLVILFRRFDYFVRDTHSLGLTMSFSHERLMLLSRVAQVHSNEWHIVYPEKEAYSIYELFQTRCDVTERVLRLSESLLLVRRLASQESISAPGWECCRNHALRCVEAREPRRRPQGPWERRQGYQHS